MKVLNRRCAGLDVHKDEVVACVRLAMRNKLSHEVRQKAIVILSLSEWQGFGPTLASCHLAKDHTVRNRK